MTHRHHDQVIDSLDERFTNQAVLRVLDTRHQGSDLSQRAPDVVRSSAVGRPASTICYNLDEEVQGHQPTKSQSCDRDLLSVQGAFECDVIARRLSQGDIPLRLNEDDDVNFLLGRASRHDAQMIRVTEVAPPHSSIREADDNGTGTGFVAWQLPLDMFSSKKRSGAEVKQRYPRRLRSYYQAQNDLISAYEALSLSGGKDVEIELPRALYKKAAFLSKITLLVNFLLLLAKIVASVLSGSMSIISSLVDSALDLISGVVMWWAARAMQHRDPYAYPQGRTKLGPVAVIILSVVMALCSLQLIRESIEKTVHLSRHESRLPVVDYITAAIAGSTVITKAILWIVCRKLPSPVVQALAQDHRNDVLSNIVALACGYFGSSNFYNITPGYYGFAYVDPAGALLISFYIIFNWWCTGSEQIKMLTGHTARPDFLSKLTWLCVNHHAQIRHIDTVRAFHFGSDFLVEVDIVLPGDMVLKEAHDIGESLQHRLESLPEVERAFVHLDYEFTHDPRSEHKIV
ncbi:metal tolerance protein [Plakobranchus ocellatus]|uniref:Metal tolerance protein n=1 Tax=Plakobranchus ocellatus TaxID=259542 RepID=A0AAV4B499_9GAST|nr:metal tolerance protein [Plakobranchus ocellatus]